MIATVDELMSEIEKVNNHKQMALKLQAEYPNSKLLASMLRIDEERLRAYEEALQEKQELY